MSSHECSRCHCTSSVFWLPLEFGLNKYELCDDCMLDLIRFFKGYAVVINMSGRVKHE